MTTYKLSLCSVMVIPYHITLLSRRASSVFCSPTEKISVIRPPDFMTKAYDPMVLSEYVLFLFNVLDFDRKRYKCHFSPFLTFFVENHPLTIVINNQNE